MTQRRLPAWSVRIPLGWFLNGIVLAIILAQLVFVIISSRHFHYNHDNSWFMAPIKATTTAATISTIATTTIETTATIQTTKIETASTVPTPDSKLSSPKAESSPHVPSNMAKMESVQNITIANNTTNNYHKYDDNNIHFWETTPNHTIHLPLWIQKYFSWHNEMRDKYPGDSLFTDPNAPNLLVRVCLGLCGGLHDRLGQLPWDVYLANQTGRLLLLHWVRPRPLEHFLIPHEFNWTMPSIDLWDNGNGTTILDRHYVKRVRQIPQLFHGFDDSQPDERFWETQLDLSIKRATMGEFRNVKLLRHRLLGHLDEPELERRLVNLGETDLLHQTPSFGKLFWAFFKPSLGVLGEWKQINQQLSLHTGNYSAVHCRVRHPKATPRGVVVLGKSKVHPADKSGLPWYGKARDFAIGVATKALFCARALLVQKNVHHANQTFHEPVYFFSDSNDLVRFMAHELTDSQFRQRNASFLNNSIIAAALASTESLRIVARDVSLENAHIDRQKNRSPQEYYGTFVDLLVAIHARCVTFGIGFYAAFAVKLSGTSCKQVYQDEEWGSRAGTKEAPRCRLGT